MLNNQKENSVEVMPGESDMLSVARTIMANERTFLSFLRTSLCFFAAGVGLIKFLDHRALEALGWAFIGSAVVVLFVGIRRYIHTRKVLRHFTPDEWNVAVKKLDL